MATGREEVLATASGGGWGLQYCRVMRTPIMGPPQGEIPRRPEVDRALAPRANLHAQHTHTLPFERRVSKGYPIN